MQSKTTDRLELAQSCLLVIGKQDPFICDKLDIINGVLFLRSHSCVDISLHGKINCNIWPTDVVWKYDDNFICVCWVTAFSFG